MWDKLDFWSGTSWSLTSLKSGLGSWGVRGCQMQVLINWRLRRWKSSNVLAHCGQECQGDQTRPRNHRSWKKFSKSFGKQCNNLPQILQLTNSCVGNFCERNQQTQKPWKAVASKCTEDSCQIWSLCAEIALMQPPGSSKGHGALPHVCGMLSIHLCGPSRAFARCCIIL